MINSLEDKVALSILKAWVERDRQMEYADRLENIEVYDRAIKELEKEPCEDCVNRESIIEALRTWIQYGHLPNGDYVPLDYLSNPEEYVAFVRFEDAETCINKMPPVSCTNLSNLYQKVTDWLSTFNTDSATECFTAVQELKKKLEGDTDAVND